MKSALQFFFVLAALPPLAPAQNLTVDNVWAHSPVIVYEFPEAEGRAEAIRYVESMRDQFKPGAEVLDATSNVASIRSKLTHGFILYTTLGEKSKLVRLATPSLGWEDTANLFHWRDITAPASDVRFILVGKNPYSQGRCVIFAAGSNRAMVEIHSVFHGPSSYHLYLETQLLKEGNYDGNFLPLEHVSQTAASEDVDQFFKTLERVHPKLLARATPEDYRKLKEQTAAGIAGKLDSDGQIPVEALASLLYYAAAFFKDGHTSVDWRTSPTEANSHGRRFPAFRLLFDNGRFLVAAAKDPSLPGMEVVAVNGMPMLEFLRPILERCAGETLGFRAARFVGSEPFWYYLTNLFGSTTPYTLTLRDVEGRQRDAPLETLNYAEYQNFLDQGGAAPFHPNDQGTQVEFFDSGATAHFMYSSFRFSNAEKKKIDAIFQEVKAKGARNLILDIRGNLGGDSSMGEYIFRYLYGGKFRSFREVSAKASWDILPLVPWWARPLVFVLRGHVVRHSIAETRAPHPAAYFSGRTLLLVDNGSFSMATDFTAMFRDYKVGTIVGYETGGVPNMFGGPYHFTLKHSRIPCSVAWTENLPPVGQPGDDEHGVIPAVPVNFQALADFKTEQDPVLAFTLRYIQTGVRP